uniref:(northern house mosquito) hypothetical protein n=1 Tax=Culex pipiens TaxID=7175 RepID=A0A8D8J1S2_CULPI
MATIAKLNIHNAKLAVLSASCQNPATPTCESVYRFPASFLPPPPPTLSPSPHLTPSRCCSSRTSCTARERWRAAADARARQTGDGCRPSASAGTAGGRRCRSCSPRTGRRSTSARWRTCRT